MKSRMTTRHPAFLLTLQEKFIMFQQSDIQLLMQRYKKNKKKKYKRGLTFHRFMV